MATKKWKGLLHYLGFGTPDVPKGYEVDLWDEGKGQWYWVKPTSAKGKKNAFKKGFASYDLAVKSAIEHSRTKK